MNRKEKKDKTTSFQFTNKKSMIGQSAHFLLQYFIFGVVHSSLRISSDSMFLVDSFEFLRTEFAACLKSQQW